MKRKASGRSPQRNLRALVEKARECDVDTSGMVGSVGTVKVHSTSGEIYAVVVNGEAAFCECDWCKHRRCGQYSPKGAKPQASFCSHSIAALGVIAKQSGLQPRFALTGGEGGEGIRFYTVEKVKPEAAPAPSVVKPLSHGRVQLALMGEKVGGLSGVDSDALFAV